MIKIYESILDIHKIKENLKYIFEDENGKSELIDLLNEIEKELFASIEKLKERIK